MKIIASVLVALAALGASAPLLAQSNQPAPPPLPPPRPPAVIISPNDLTRGPPPPLERQFVTPPSMAPPMERVPPVPPLAPRTGQ